MHKTTLLTGRCLRRATYAALNKYLVSNLFMNGVTGYCSQFQQNSLVSFQVWKKICFSAACLCPVADSNTIRERTQWSMLRCKVIMLCHDDDIKLRLKQAAANPSESPKLQSHPAAERHSAEKSYFGISRRLVRVGSRGVSHSNYSIQLDMIHLRKAAS
jgi:hypothetical protein